MHDASLSRCCSAFPIPDRSLTLPHNTVRIEELKLLSKVEEAGLLSKLEESGLTLSFIEKNGLLSTAEKFGLLSLIADRYSRTSVICMGGGGH